MIQQAGRYRARAVPGSGKFGEAATGTAQVSVLFELLDEEGNPTVDTITWFGSFTEKTEDRTIEALQIAGARMAGGSLNDLEGLGSTEVELVIEPHTYQGKTSMRVNFVNTGGGGRVSFKKPLEGGGLLALQERMKGKILAKQQGAPGGATQADAGGDDIPF